MELSLRRILRILDGYRTNKIKEDGFKAKYNFEELQYMVNNVRQHHCNTKRYENKKYRLQDNGDVLDIKFSKMRDNSKSKLRKKGRDGMLPDISATMLPSIHTAVEHFRKIMKRPQDSFVHLPPLYQSYDDADHDGSRRMKYKHRSLDELMRTSENWDRLQYILSQENVTNSIDLVFEANKPHKSALQSLECSPPLISADFSREITRNKKREMKEKTALNDMKHNSDSTFQDESDPYITTDKGNRLEQKDENVVKEITKSDKTQEKKEINPIPVPLEEKPRKKKVRFNLDNNIHRDVYVKALKTSRVKEKQRHITSTRKFSYFNELNGNNKKKPKRIGMTQIFKGQHPDNYYRKLES